MKMADILYIIVPCFNEEEVLPITATHLKGKLEQLTASKKISEKSKILFVNDGSSDSTWDIVNSLNKQCHIFSGLNLSKNYGHQNALVAGLDFAVKRADIIISIDADLQDDINAIEEMLEKHRKGCDIVYGVRSDRKSDNFFKRTTAGLFYRFMNFLDTKTVFNHADYRLMSKRAVEALLQFDEINLFLRGIIPMLGFRSEIVYYKRNKRIAGKSKYSLSKMISFALNGITSFSSKPIRYITLAGFLIFIISIIMIIYFICQWYGGNTVSGWPSVICSVWAIGGLLMLSVGIIGEYIGKIYTETKHRPRFIVESSTDE